MSFCSIYLLSDFELTLFSREAVISRKLRPALLVQYTDCSDLKSPVYAQECWAKFMHIYAAIECHEHRQFGV
jgi:hypothetical protein